MNESLAANILLPIGLGLFGFIEPCSIGSTLVFIKVMEGKSTAVKLWQVSVFTLTRAVFIGILGVLAALIGSVFFGFQKIMWVGLGAIYCAIGVLYFFNRERYIMKAIGPGLARIGEVRGSAVLGLLFGLNIPACSAPLLIVLLGTAAAGGASGNLMAQGFVSLALFGLALSLPLVAAVLIPPVRRSLDWIARLSRRVPRWTGVLFIALGLWSIWFGLYVSIK